VMVGEMSVQSGYKRKYCVKEESESFGLPSPPPLVNSSIDSPLTPFLPAAATGAAAAQPLLLFFPFPM